MQEGREEEEATRRVRFAAARRCWWWRRAASPIGTCDVVDATHVHVVDEGVERAEEETNSTIHACHTSAEAMEAWSDARKCADEATRPSAVITTNLLAEADAERCDGRRRGR